MTRVSCDICYDSFGSLGALKSHQKYKHKQRLGPKLTPAIPLFRFLKQRSAPKPPANAYPIVEEPIAEHVISNPAVKKRRKVKRLKWKAGELKIISAILPELADTKSPEYREAIREHYFSLKEKYHTLNCKAYAKANPNRLTERTFQKWCTDKARKTDRDAIKNNPPQPPLPANDKSEE